jgi:hypothetical protein
MRKYLLALLAASTLAGAAPAFAHDDYGDDDWNASSYSDFNQLYQHLWQGIQHGVSDGSYTPGQVRYFARELRNIRARAQWEEESGYYDPRDIDARLNRLHERMHIAHDRGHERLNNDWYGGSNSYSPYGDPYRSGYGNSYGNSYGDPYRSGYGNSYGNPYSQYGDYPRR